MIDIQEMAKRTKLASMRTGMFQANRHHKSETKAENERHGSGDRARVLVRITDHAALVALRKLHTEARGAHFKLTMPSAMDGVRLIPVARELEHADMLLGYKRKHEALAAEFLGDYDAEREAARVRLNGLFDPDMFPPKAQVAECFRFDWRYLDTPTEGAWAEWFQESARAAQAELREALIAALRRVSERCASNGKLHETVFSNLAELLDLIPDFNVTRDPVIAAAAARAASIAVLTAEPLRADPAKRAAVAERANSILSVFGAGALAGGLRADDAEQVSA